MAEHPSSAKPAGRIRFGVFELDLRTGDLRKAGARVKLAGQPLRLLERLLERPGDLVTREELRQELWSDDTFVDFERNLNSAIKRLRAALGDSADSPRFVETLPRRGYRFLAPIERIPAASVSPAADAAAASSLPSPGATAQHPVAQRSISSWLDRHKRAGWLTAAATLTLLAAVLLFNARRSATPASRTIAVLPFVVAGAAPAESEHLAFGLSEALITELSRYGGLRVISQTSSMQYKDADRTLPEIARELGVDVVVEGSVQREGNRLRITAQLIEAATDTHLWADKYERELGSVLTVVDDVARAVAAEIHVQVSDVPTDPAARIVDPAVADAYLKGRYYLGRANEADSLRAVSYFEQALAFDPSHAPSHSGLADYYVLTDSLPPDVASEKAGFHARRALELDERLPDAHASLAFLHFYYDWNWQAAEREFRRAIELDPGHARALRWFGLFLSAMGRHAEALEQAQMAVARDPLSAASHEAASMVQFNARQYAAATASARTIQELNAFDPRGREYAALGLIHQQRYTEAIAELERGLELARTSVPLRLMRVICLYRLGRTDEAGEVLGLLERDAKRQYVAPVFFAIAYAQIGRAARALDLLERAYEEHDAYLVLVNVSPWFDPLRQDTRFQRLRERLRFPGVAPREGRREPGQQPMGAVTPSAASRAAARPRPRA